MKSQARYMRNLREKRRSLGLCTRCGRTLDREGAICVKCSEYLNLAATVRRAKYGRKSESAQQTKRNKDKRLKVFQHLSGSKIPFCNYCKCDVYKALQLNHRHGGGNHERKKRTVNATLGMLLSGKLDWDDYEVTCLVCNARHYGELSLGLQWQVIYVGQNK